jgi:hypothetical protein
MIRYNTEFGIVRKKHSDVPVKKGRKQQQEEDAELSMDSDQIADEEFQNKRIQLKILRFRSRPYATIGAEEFKTRSVVDMHRSVEVTEFRDKVQK